MVYVVLLTIATKYGVCQSIKIDSLKSLLPAKTVFENADILYDLAYELTDVDDESGLIYARDAFRIATRSGDSLRIVKAGRMKSLLFRRLEMLDSSLVLSHKIIAIARRNSFESELESLLNGVGLLYLFKARYDSALKYFFECLELRERQQNEYQIGIVSNNIGLVYYNLKDYDNALKYFRKVLMPRDEKNIYNIEVTLNNMGLCFAYNNDFDSAFYYINKSFEKCKSNNRSCPSDFDQIAYFSLGVAYFRQERFGEAEREFTRSYELAKIDKSARFQLDNIVHLLHIYSNKYEFGLAEKYLKAADSLIISGTQYNAELINVYARFISMFEKLGNFEKVAIYQNKYIALKDSIFDEQLTTNLMRIQSEYLEKENKAKIESQNKILALNQEVILRQKYLNISIGLVALLLVTVTALLLKSNRQKQKMNGLLDVKVRERTKELELNRDALQRACEERDIVIDKTSRDIKMSLVTIKGLCSVGLKDVKDPVALQYIHKMDSSSDKFSEILRRLQLTKSSTFSAVS